MIDDLKLDEIRDIYLKQNSKQLQTTLGKQKIEELESQIESVHRSLRVRRNHLFLEQANRTLDLLIQDKKIKSYLAEMFEKKCIRKMRFKDTYWIMLCSHPNHEPDELENESSARYCLALSFEISRQNGPINWKTLEVSYRHFTQDSGPATSHWELVEFNTNHPEIMKGLLYLSQPESALHLLVGTLEQCN